MPKKARYFDAISQMFWVALVKPFADRQPHVNEDEHAAEHMHAMQTSDREIAGKVRAMLSRNIVAYWTSSFSILAILSVGGI